jgi:RNA ligase
VVLNYTPAAACEAEWTPWECLCRGLIINRKTGEMVARPFDKFFNWGEGGRTTAAPIVNVLEKMDGSLGILFRHDGQYGIATRGSFTSPQATWATRYLREHINLTGLPDEDTLLFEIIYPENRIVVDYGERQELVLLAVRNRHTGTYRSREEVVQYAERYRLELPASYQFASTEAILTQLPVLSPNCEGYVVEFADGQRFKFKGDQYRQISRAVQHMNQARAVELVAQGRMDALDGIVPEALLRDFKEMMREIHNKVVDMEYYAQMKGAIAPKGDRKTFAAYAVQQGNPWTTMLFALYDGKPLRPVIFRVIYGYHGEVKE